MQQQIRRVREQKVSRKKMKASKKGKKVETLFFPMFCGPTGSQRRLAKVADPEPLRCEAHVDVKMAKSHF